MREQIHFVHGNGFPSPCYHQVLKHLESIFDCYYIDKVGHSPLFPVTENWGFLVNEVLDSIRTQASRPVIAVGHSLGGVLSLFAAIEAPELFQSVILLDSPLLGRIKSTLLRWAKILGVIDKVTPASQTRFRCRHWSTREKAIQYLKNRTLFQNFSESALEDYIDYGMERTNTGFQLRFSPEIEYQIYRTIPDICYQFEGKLRTKTALIYGLQSHLVTSSVRQYMQRRYGVTCYPIRGTHMFPMEYPKACAEEIVKIAQAL